MGFLCLYLFNGLLGRKLRDIQWTIFVAMYALKTVESEFEIRRTDHLYCLVTATHGCEQLSWGYLPESRTAGSRNASVSACFRQTSVVFSVSHSIYIVLNSHRQDLLHTANREKSTLLTLPVLRSDTDHPRMPVVGLLRTRTRMIFRQKQTRNCLRLNISGGSVRNTTVCARQVCFKPIMKCEWVMDGE